jgi:putative peptidoglycan lipid II flippase
MAAQYAENNLEAVRSTLARAVRVLLFLTVPSAIGMLVLRYEIIAAIFQFGAFTSTSTELVAGALGYFALGLVAYAVVEVLTRGFYALHDTVTPVTVSVATVLVNLALATYLALGLNMSQEGLALGLALTTTLEMILLWVLLGRKLPGWRLSNGGVLASLGRTLPAAAVMGVLLYLSLPLLHAVVPAGIGNKFQAAALAVLGIIIGGAIYLAAAVAFRSEEVSDAWGLLSRRIGRRS